jgi:tRNA pseudouridine55 synthase
MYNGVLLLDKPPGLTSNAALQSVRRLFGWSKAGHTGTLDPLATGLLPICLGEATKFSHALLDGDKSYEAEINLGFTSSTGDAEGVLERCSEPDFLIGRLQEVLGSFIGPLAQVPPMHSALKKNGKPLYSYARDGETVEREPRLIIINTLQLIDFKESHVRIYVGCSKGTYIRVLAEDIGKVLGCGAYLSSLRRTGIRDLSVLDAVGLQELAQMDEVARAERLLPVDRLVEMLPALHLNQAATQRIINGLSVIGTAAAVGLLRLYDPTGGFLGVGDCGSDGTLTAKRLVSQHSTSKDRLLC